MYISLAGYLTLFTTLRLLTLNTGQTPLPDGKDWKTERVKVLIDAILENDEFDVLCFQEIFWRPSRLIFIERLKDRYPYYFIDGSLGRYFFGLNSGLAIFSKYPIVDKVIHTYKDYRGVEDLAMKGVIGVKINLNPGREPQYIHVFTTHIQSGIGEEPYAFTIFDKFTGSKGSKMDSHELKKSQINELVKIIQKFSNMSRVVIAGDLNVDSMRSEYKFLKTVLNSYEIKDLFNKKFSFLNTSTIKDDKRIDYVWSNLKGYSIITSKYGNKQTTDHRDVIAKLYVS